MNNHTTDEIFPPEASTTDEQALRFIDIHIYEHEPEAEEPLHVESQPEQPEPASYDESEDTKQPQCKRKNIIAFCASIVCVSLLAVCVLIYALPLLTPDATIMLVPNTQQVRTTIRMTVNTEQATGTQLQGRALATITMNQARTVPTTGKGHQDARAAHGYVTFYNAAPSPQTVTAGTLLTGADGVQIVTDQDATMTAVNYPTLGQATVAAHALLTGPVGNIAGGDIYGPCCRLNVSAVSTAFRGGQQARDYQTVTQQDITSVVSRLKTSLNQSVQAALQTQVQSDETLITPLPCSLHVSPDRQPGEEAAQVSITVNETCSGTTYKTQAFSTLVTHVMTQAAKSSLGNGYTMLGMVQASVNQVIRKGNGQEDLSVTCAGIWGYQFTQEQQAQIKQRIAGKSKTQAITTLLHIPGVQTVSIENGHLPTDVAHIHLVFLVMQ